ncbi:hypothetical protein ABIE78_000598 [Sinorhizobium fredii]
MSPSIARTKTDFYVVMENAAETLLVETAEIAGKRLGKGVADRVRVAQAFPFHDLDRIIHYDKVRYRQRKHG